MKSTRETPLRFSEIQSVPSGFNCSKKEIKKQNKRAQTIQAVTSQYSQRRYLFNRRRKKPLGTSAVTKWLVSACGQLLLSHFEYVYWKLHVFNDYLYVHNENCKCLPRFVTLEIIVVCNKIWVCVCVWKTNGISVISLNPHGAISVSVFIYTLGKPLSPLDFHFFFFFSSAVTQISL